MIAQELEKIYPELVTTDSKGMKSVAYANISALLIEAVKDLKTEKDTEIKSLKTQLDQVNREVTELKKLLKDRTYQP